MFRAFLAKLKMWRIARAVKPDDCGTPVYEGTMDIRLKNEHCARLPAVADTTSGESFGRCGAKIQFAKEVLYEDGSLSTIEIHTNEESQRALKTHEDKVREANWRALHPQINPSTSG